MRFENRRVTIEGITVTVEISYYRGGKAARVQASSCPSTGSLRRSAIEMVDEIIEGPSLIGRMIGSLFGQTLEKRVDRYVAQLIKRMVAHAKSTIEHNYKLKYRQIDNRNGVVIECNDPSKMPILFGGAIIDANAIVI